MWNCNVWLVSDSNQLSLACGILCNFALCVECDRMYPLVKGIMGIVFIVLPKEKGEIIKHKSDNGTKAC